MKPLIRTLSATAVGAVMLTTGFAGPGGDAHPSFAYQPQVSREAEPIQIALFRTSMKERPAMEGRRMESRMWTTDETWTSSTSGSPQLTGRSAPRY